MTNIFIDHAPLKHKAGDIRFDNTSSGLSAEDVQAALDEINTTISGVIDLQGDLDASSNPLYPSASKGHAYVITVGGKVGGASGKDVNAGDLLVAKNDNAGGDEATVGSDWFILESNRDQATETSKGVAEIATQAETDAETDDLRYITPLKIGNWLTTKTTDDISEGSNLYYQDERVDDRINLLFQDGTGISWTYDDVNNTFTGTVSLTPFSTTDLSEGSNLYFTDERVDDRVSVLIQDTADLTWTYDDGANTFSAVVNAGADDTALHDNVDGEINAITEKTTPVSGDMLVIEDSAASFAKKKVQVGNLPSGTSGSTESISLSGQTIDGAANIGDLLYFKSSTSTWTRVSDIITPQAMMSDTDEVTFFGKVTGLSGLTAGEMYFQDNVDKHLITTDSTSEVKIGAPISATEFIVDIDVEGSNLSASEATISTHSTLSTGLVGYWSSNTDGSFPDATGNGHTGTINGATFTASGKIDGAYDYDGTDDSVSIGDDDAFSFTDGAGNDEPFSIAFWINPDAAGTGETVISKWDDGSALEYHAEIVGDARLNFSLSDSDVDTISRPSASALQNDVWQHVAITYDGSNAASGISIYIDGSLDVDTPNENASYDGMSNTATSLEIGRKLRGLAKHFNGQIDEIGLWSKEFTASEVSDLYNGGDGLPFD